MHLESSDIEFTWSRVPALKTLNSVQIVHVVATNALYIIATLPQKLPQTLPQKVRKTWQYICCLVWRATCMVRLNRCWHLARLAFWVRTQTIAWPGTCMRSYAWAARSRFKINDSTNYCDRNCQSVVSWAPSSRTWSRTASAIGNIFVWAHSLVLPLKLNAFWSLYSLLC